MIDDPRPMARSVPSHSRPRQPHPENFLDSAPEDHLSLRTPSDRVALLEFQLADPPGEPASYKSLNASLVHDGVWVDVHISKGSFKPEDQALFEAVLGSVRIEP